MNITSIESRFAEMGARFKCVLQPPSSNIWIHGIGRTLPYAMDIGRDRHGACFELRVPENVKSSLEPLVSQADPHQRHLLLMIRVAGDNPHLDRFLCGHDEKDWFVASVPGGASTIRQAFTALQPDAVRQALNGSGLSARKQFKRRNEVFLRQGEWFFLPEPDLMVDEFLILRQEPISRGAGKPHVVSELYRTGGRSVYVCRKHPNGITGDAYRSLLRQNPSAAGWGWNLRKRDPRVYARGEVHHPDHASLELPIWHRVHPNTENKSLGRSFVAFID
jgi:hypothetical protein